MKYSSVFLFIFSFVAFCNLALAEPRIGSREVSGPVTPLCVNDKAGTKKLYKMDIVESLNASKEPLVAAFNKYKKDLKTVITTPPSCTNCVSNNLMPQSAVRGLLNWSMQAIHLTAPAGQAKQIKKECIEASTQRSPGNKGYVCDGNPPEGRMFENTGDSAPCLDQNSIDYIHFSVNEALKCFASLYKPIDTRFILKKFNNETAFNFFIGYSGGKGLGQLTTPPTLELRENGVYILEDVASSSNPACEPFKKIAKADLKTAPPRIASSANICSWVSPGEGLTRNLLYSLGYYIQLRDKYVAPGLKRRNASQMALKSGLIDDFTLIAYGPDGWKESQALMATLKLSNASDPEKIRAGLQKHNDYYQQTEQKMGELQDYLNSDVPSKNSPAKSKEQLRGDTCVY